MNILFKRTDLPGYTQSITFQVKDTIREQLNERIGIENKDMSDLINELLEKALNEI